MDVTMIGLQNAGKSSLLRVLAVSLFLILLFFLFLFASHGPQLLTISNRVESSQSSEL